MSWLVTSSDGAVLLAELTEPGADTERDVGVERRGRLVEHQQTGPVQRGAHDPDQGPLTGRELGAHRVGEVLDPEPGEAGFDRRLGIGRP